MSRTSIISKTKFLALALAVVTLYGCGSDNSADEVAELNVDTCAVCEIDDFSEITEEEYLNADSEISDIPAESSEVSDTDENSMPEYSASVGSSDSSSSAIATNTDWSSYHRSIEEIFYGYSMEELYASTVTQLVNDKMGYSRSNTYTQRNMQTFVPFSINSDMMVCYQKYMNETPLSELKILTEQWDTLSETQKMALAGFAYSGLLPEDVFMCWGLSRDEIHSYASAVSELAQ